MAIQQTSNTYTTTGAATISYQVPFALKNCKSIFFVFGCAENLNSYNQYSLSNRESLGISQAQLSVNGLVIPANRMQQIEYDQLQYME